MDNLKIKKMRNFKPVLSMVIIVILSACTVGVNKDLLSGLSYSYKGLSVEDAYLTLDNEKYNSNEVEYGKKVYIVLNGVEGYVLEEGKAKIGCKIEVKDSEGNVVLSADDAFAAYSNEGIDPKQAEILNISLTIGSPLEADKEYDWEALFWDKNGEGTINTKIKVKVVPESE